MRGRAIFCADRLSRQFNQRFFIDLSPVIETVHFRVFNRVNGIAPAPCPGFPQHRAAFVAAHRVLRSRNTDQPVLLGFNNQVSALADRALVNDEPIYIAVIRCRAAPVKCHIGQHQQ